MASEIWDDTDRAIGQLFMMGFDGPTVTPQIEELIETHWIGSLLLTAKNLKSAEQATKLVHDLQKIAYDAGHPVPLLIATDQENGGVNSLFDEIYIRQFPSAMGIAATGSVDLAYATAKATAEELSACGVNWIMGPCLDTLANARNQALGVRAFGDDPHLVSSFGTRTLKGYQDAGLATMGKHFPSYGNLDLGSALDVPTITDSIEQLSHSALIPFRAAIQEGLDAMMVGGCAMSSAGLETMHACLSEQVVDNLLRDDLNFNGVVVSECLEMEALTHNIGVGGGTIMAINAGCDIVLLCRSFSAQQEALATLKLGIEDSMISRDRIRISLQRVLTMKSKCTDWTKALSSPGISLLSTLQPSHTALSKKAYDASISVVRDKGSLLPITSMLEAEEELVLLTPLVKPLAASAASRALSKGFDDSPEPHGWARNSAVMSGEQVFRELGKSLARARAGRLLHTSYTSSGIRPIHEDLISRAGAVIVVTADANRNLYQTSFTKHLALLCRMGTGIGSEKREKPLICVAVSSPYDFAADTRIGTYIATYDFTETSMGSLVGVLCGELALAGRLPGSTVQSQKLHHSRQHWLVEAFNEERDAQPLETMMKLMVEESKTTADAELKGVTSASWLLHRADVLEAHFVVRNSSTKAVYGFCSTYYFKASSTGAIGGLFVDPTRRRLSIGISLHSRAIRTLLQYDGITRFQIGTRLPSIYLGLPADRAMEAKRLRAYFTNVGWNTSLSRPVCRMIARNISNFEIPKSIASSLKKAIAEYDLVFGRLCEEQILSHIKTSSRQGIYEIYKVALRDPSACGIIRAKRPDDGSILGTLLLYSQHSVLVEYVPSMKTTTERMGGMSSPVIAPSVGDYATILQSMFCLGLKQAKQRGCDSCMLDYADGDGGPGPLTSMGFEVLHRFEEISCDAENWAPL